MKQAKNTTITVDEFISMSDYYNSLVDKADEKLKSVISGHINCMGLVDDDFRKTDEYIKAKKEFDKYFKQLRDYNSTIPNNIKGEASLKRRMLKMKNNH